MESSAFRPNSITAKAITASVACTGPLRARWPKSSVRFRTMPTTSASRPMKSACTKAMLPVAKYTAESAIMSANEGSTKPTTAASAPFTPRSR